MANRSSTALGSTSNFHHSINNSKRFSIRHSRIPSTDNLNNPRAPPSPMKTNSSYSSLVSNPTPPTKPATYSTGGDSNTLLSSINRQSTTVTARKPSGSKETKAAKEGKRLSIFPWSNRKSSVPAAASHNNYYNSERLPVISDPVLEFSTADFFTSGEEAPKARPVPVITAYPPSSHAINTRNSIIQDRRASSSTASLTASRSSLPSPHLPKTPRTPVSPAIMENSEESMTSQLDGQLGLTETKKKEHERTASVQTVDECVQTDNAPAESTAELRRKLREAEQKTINVLIEYQQKIDKSRKRVIELERRLQDEQRINREMSNSGTIIMIPSTPVTEERPPRAASSPVSTTTSMPNKGMEAPGSKPTSAQTLGMTPAQMQVRITALEGQRDNLREAIRSLKHNKELELKKCKEQISRMNRMNSLQRSLAWDPYMVKPSSGSSSSSIPRSPATLNGEDVTPVKQTASHRRSYSAHPAFSLGSSAVSAAAAAKRQQQPSLDLSIAGDSSYASPMSASSSTGTVHSVSSRSSTESTWTSTSSTGTFQKSSGAGSHHHHQQQSHSQHQQQQPQHKNESTGATPRRIGVGPFLPVEHWTSHLQQQGQQQGQQLASKQGQRAVPAVN